MSKAPLILVDGSSYLYRAFYALPPLTTSAGKPTGAVRGVIAMTRKLAQEYPDSTLVMVFDAKGKTFRDDLYAEYKSQRPPMPDDLRAQIEPLHACVKALGWPMIVHSGVEADDVIGTIAVEQSKQGQTVLISTGDKDMAQLVGPEVSLVNTMTGNHLDTAGVEEKYGIPPSLIIDYLALIGDKSDNIPGVPGVGEKSALPMLQALGGLESIFSDLEKVRELSFRGAKKMPEKLQEHKDQAFLSYQLATIRTDVDLELKEYKHAEPDTEALRQLFTELEFKAWVAELDQPSNTTPQVNHAPIQTDYQCILTEAELNQWLGLLGEAPKFAFDTETTSLDYMQAEIVGLSFAVEPNIAAYVPLAHDYPGAPEQLDRDRVLAKLKPLLEDPKREIIGQNLKYDMSVLANYGIQVRAKIQDTMLLSYILDATGGRHDMDSLAERYLQRKTIHFEEVAGKGAKQLTFNQVALEQAVPYAAEDADVTLQLYQTLSDKLSVENGLSVVYQTIETPLVNVLSRIERNGARLDSDALHVQSDEIAQELQHLETRVHDLAGQTFNLGSPKQLQEILFDKMQLPVLKKTPGGKPSTAEDVLQDLAEQYEIPKLILDYRSLAKLKSTYTDKLPLMVNPQTGRVHTSYHQAVAATGRLSSSNPNLQNIPVRTGEGRRIRKAFVAPEGELIVAADYSQIELRIMAHLSGDQGLLQAFADETDVHTATAAEVFSVDLADVSADQRRSAKAINFGLMYGMSAFGLAKQLHITRKDAQEYINRYFDRYPGVRQFMDSIRAKAVEQGYVETLFGRRLMLRDIKSRNAQARQAAERTAINAPMQGTAADIIKRAMIDIDTWLRDSQSSAKMIMQVHDELVFEVPKSDLDMFTEQIRQRMESAAELKVPLVVEVGFGGNWEAAH